MAPEKCPLALQIDGALRRSYNDMSTFFAMCDSVIRGNIGITPSEELQSVVFTVGNDVFQENLDFVQSRFDGQRQAVNPFHLSLTLQCFVMGLQVVSGGLPKPLDDGTWEKQELKTIGHRTIVLRRENEKYFANDVPIKEVRMTNHSTVFMMEKLLWIRPEDIETAIVGLTE